MTRGIRLVVIAMVMVGIVSLRGDARAIGLTCVQNDFRSGNFVVRISVNYRTDPIATPVTITQSWGDGYVDFFTYEQANGTHWYTHEYPHAYTMYHVETSGIDELESTCYYDSYVFFE